MVLKYVIKNLLSAYAGIAFKDIKIDKLNNINIQEVIKDQKVYDYIAKLNKDITREKNLGYYSWEMSLKSSIIFLIFGINQSNII